MIDALTALVVLLGTVVWRPPEPGHDRGGDWFVLEGRLASIDGREGRISVESEATTVGRGADSHSTAHGATGVHLRHVTVYVARRTRIVEGTGVGWRPVDLAELQLGERLTIEGSVRRAFDGGRLFEAELITVHPRRPLT
jgi:hypothetical protein